MFTGAGSGIGRVIGLLFAREGCSAVVTEIDIDGGVEAVQEVNGQVGVAKFLRVNASDPSDVQTMFDSAESEYAGLDVVINHAEAGGHCALPLERIGDTTPAAFVAGVLGEVLPAFLGTTRSAVAAFRRRGVGAIVNTASSSSFQATSGLLIHDVGKAAMLQLTRTTAIDYENENIRANCIGPGPTLVGKDPRDIVSWTSDPDQTIQQRMTTIPMRRPSATIEQSERAFCLASDEASYITDNALPIDGELLAWSHNPKEYAETQGWRNAGQQTLLDLARLDIGGVRR